MGLGVGSRGKLHIGVAVLHGQRVAGSTHAALQIALIAEDDAAHETGHPDIGGSAGTVVVIAHLLGLDGAAGVALIQRCAAYTGDTAHTKVPIADIVADVDDNVRHGGAAR